MPGALVKTAKIVGTVAVVGAVGTAGIVAAHKPIATFTCNAASSVSEELDPDHCIKAVAVKMLDVSMCDSIKGERFAAEIEGKKVQLENPPKMECITEIAEAMNLPNLCDKVEGVLIANTKLDCLYRVAVANRNPGACAGIGNDTQSRAGAQMNRAGCIAAVGRTAAEDAEVATKELCETKGGSYDGKAKNCACPAGASMHGAGNAEHCACEIKPTGIMHSLFGFGSSKWHTLRPGEDCGWWQGWYGGDNLGKNRRECYAGGGKGFDLTEGTCTCPSDAKWDDEAHVCRCDNGTKLSEGGTCPKADN